MSLVKSREKKKKKKNMRFICVFRDAIRGIVKGMSEKEEGGEKC